MQNKNRLVKKKFRFTDALLYFLIIVSSVCVIGMVLFFIAYILIQGLPHVTWEFLSTQPNPLKNTVGILPSLVNTLYVILLSLLFAVPIGVGGAIYLQEYAKEGTLMRVIEFTTETLSGIPSIIFGVFGYMFFSTFLKLNVSLIAGALTLTLIVLPTIVRTTQEALRSVPKSYRDAALGLGATKWYMIRTVLLPSSATGIFTSIILAVGRIVGESAALMLVAGGSGLYLPKGNFFEQIFGSGSTLSVELYRYAYSRGDNETGFAIAAVLLVIVLVLNLITKAAQRHIKKKV